MTENRRKRPLKSSFRMIGPLVFLTLAGWIGIGTLGCGGEGEGNPFDPDDKLTKEVSVTIAAAQAGQSLDVGALLFRCSAANIDIAATRVAAEAKGLYFEGRTQGATCTMLVLRPDDLAASADVMVVWLTKAGSLGALEILEVCSSDNETLQIDGLLIN